MCWASGGSSVNDRQEWNRSLFETLTSNRLSRNKYFAKFATGWSKAVHRRYRVVVSLRKEAARLGAIPETSCWISVDGSAVLFHLQCPRLQYLRVVALQPYEWEWLGRQAEIKPLLNPQTQELLPGA